jgi:hypothetical protein
MMKNFLARQNQGTRIAVSRPESGINVCRKWDDFRRKGEWARRRGAILRVGRFGLTAMASDECVCAWGLTPSSRTN